MLLSYKYLFLGVSMAVGGCAMPGGARYLADIGSDGTIHIDVNIRNDSEMVNVRLVRDPETGRITGFEFSKQGTEGDAATKSLLVQQTLALERLLNSSGGTE